MEKEKMKVISKENSKDGAIKYLFGVKRNGMNYSVEGVFLDLPYRELRYIICASTQIGCYQRCTFCESSKLPFAGNLKSAEINEQLYKIVDDNPCIKKEGKVEYAFEGIGEPLMNYKSVVDSINSHEKKVQETNFVISTVGIPEQIYRLASENFRYETRLHISLHFPTDEKRRKFMPSAKRVSIEEILKSSKEFAIKKKSRVALNYLLIEGENDSKKDIEDLAGLIRDDKKHFYVKLSYLNNGILYHSPSREKFEGIKLALEKEGIIETKIFKSIGTGINAGCGQLALKSLGRRNAN